MSCAVHDENLPGAQISFAGQGCAAVAVPSLTELHCYRQEWQLKAQSAKNGGADLQLQARRLNPTCLRRTPVWYLMIWCYPPGSHSTPRVKHRMQYRNGWQTHGAGLRLSQRRCTSEGARWQACRGPASPGWVGGSHPLRPEHTVHPGTDLSVCHVRIGSNVRGPTLGLSAIAGEPHQYVGRTPLLAHQRAPAVARARVLAAGALACTERAKGRVAGSLLGCCVPGASRRRDAPDTAKPVNGFGSCQVGRGWAG